MAQVEQADRQAWLASVMAAHELPLVRYAARITGDVERARDVVQETFLRLLSTRRGPQADHHAPWLFAVCRNRALDVIRKERRMSTLSDARADSQAGGDPSPPALAERREAVAGVMAILADLPAQQQEVVRLKFQNDFTYRQIAAVTGLSASNVGFLIHKAISTIRQKLHAGPGKTGLA